MITLTIAIAAGCGAFAAARWPADLGTGWSIFIGVLAFGTVQLAVGLLLQRKVKREMERVQAILVGGQKKLQQKMSRWQMRPPGSIQAAQKEIADDTKAFVAEALAATGALEKYKLWIPMMERQIATARLQLSWMVKDFKTVDKLMPKAICIDPVMRCMKMARMQMLGEPVAEIEKIYKKGVARARYNENTLLAAAMSWIQLKRGDTDGAFKTLTEALKKSDDATLKHNHECLMNNRPAQFTNAGLGDQWYSLLLEEPKIKHQRQRPIYR